MLRAAGQRVGLLQTQNIFDNFFAAFNGIATFGIVFFAIFLVVFVVMLILIIKKTTEERNKNKSARAPFIPPVSSEAMEEDMPFPSAKAGNFCIHCGLEIQPGSEYCSHCGKKQVQRYTKQFTRSNMSNDEFIQMVNTWLASNSRIANVTCQMQTSTGYGMLVNQYFLDHVVLQFELFNKPNQMQYAIVELKKYGYKKTETAQLLAEWQAANPTAKVLSRDGGTTMRGQSGSLLMNGLGASNNAQLFVFFKFPRA